MTKIKICQDGVLIAVECKAWAENIKHDRMERKGLAHFEVFIFLFNVANIDKSFCQCDGWKKLYIN